VSYSNNTSLCSVNTRRCFIIKYTSLCYTNHKACVVFTQVLCCFCKRLTCFCSTRLCLKSQFHPLPFSLFTFQPLPLPGCLLYGRQRQEQRLLCERIRMHTGRENVIHWQRMLECWVNILQNDVSLQRAWHDWGDRYRYKVTWLTGLLSSYHTFRNWLVKQFSQWRCEDWRF